VDEALAQVAQHNDTVSGGLAAVRLTASTALCAALPRILLSDTPVHTVVVITHPIDTTQRASWWMGAADALATEAAAMTAWLACAASAARACQQEPTRCTLLVVPDRRAVPPISVFTNLLSHAVGNVARAVAAADAAADALDRVFDQLLAPRPYLPARPLLMPAPVRLERFAALFGEPLDDAPVRLDGAEDADAASAAALDVYKQLALYKI